MPIYEYQCTKCKKLQEIWQKITEDALTKCPLCKGKIERQISASGFALKGTGWYKTDYERKGKPDRKESDGGSDASSDSGSEKSGDAGESKTSDAKSEGKESKGKSEGKSAGKSEGKSEGKTSGSDKGDAKSKAKAKGKSKSAD